MPSDRIAAVMTDAQLRRLARAASADETPVLIEVAGPTVAASLPLAGRGSAPQGAPTVVPVEQSTGARSPDAERDLTRILGTRPRYLSAAHAYAAVTTGAQLAALAANPAVLAIRPNRVLHMTR